MSTLKTQLTLAVVLISCVNLTEPRDTRVLDPPLFWVTVRVFLDEVNT